MYAALVASLLWGGCAHTRPTVPGLPPLPAQFPRHTADQILEHIILSSDTLDAFRARASFSVRTPERAGSFSAEVRARAHDSLYLSISPGFGIEAARALVTPDSLYLYDRIHNELLYGSVQDAQGALGIPVDDPDLFRSFLGIIFPDPNVAWTVRANDSLYTLTDPTGVQRYTIDPRLWRVTTYQQVSPEGAIVEERAFSDFDVFDGVYLPRRISFRMPVDHSSASLYYRDLELNPASLSFQLHVNDTARRNRL
ncbi:MAG TPA: DUF4292 domain-containing protein [Rhodothermales bacterium]|nr:DUF4292 domain-containing protein [Rhodothermales bacterium]